MNALIMYNQKYNSMRNIDISLIQVLWVEDDKDLIERVQLDAYSAGLCLIPFSCWDDANKALVEDYDRWSAIILDAKCKKSADGDDNAVAFLGEALKDITVLGAKKNRIIPWYVFTGGDEKEVSDSIIDERMEWDKDWTKKTHKKYYSKNTDDEELYARIRLQANKSLRLQVYEKYKKAIDQIEVMNRDASDNVLDILVTMHYPDSHSHFKPILYYNPLRQILEYNFRAAYKVCIIPKECFDEKGNPNLSQCCHYLSGNDATHAGVRYGSKEKKDRVIPLHIELMMRMILDVGNINSHSTLLNDSQLKELEQYFNDKVFNSRFLIYSLALNVCEITLWFKKYIDGHQDVEANKMKCKYLDGLKEGEAKDNNVRNDDSGVVEYDDGNYHLGKKYLLNKEFIETRKWLGKRVKVIISINNTDAKTKDHYPLYAKKIDNIPD